MRARVRPSTVVALTVCGGLAAVTALSTNSGGDYALHAPVGGDNPAPAISALAHGHLAGYVAKQPLMGPVSLILRAPFVALADLFHGGNLLDYRLGALACLLPVALFYAWLISTQMRGSGIPRGEAVVMTILMLYLLRHGPALRAAIFDGHPEEPLAAMLTVCSVLAASRGRATLCGLALGLAFGTMEWALIAVVPVLLMLRADRRRAIGIALAVVAVLYGPGLIADPDALVRSGRVLANRGLVNAFSAWWIIGQPLHVLGAVSPTVRHLPAGLTRERLVLIMAAAAAAVWAAARLAASRGVRVRDPFALLALLGLVRVVGDPLPLTYYYLAVLTPLLTWELVALRRLPLVYMATLAYVQLVPGDALHLDAATTTVVSLVWMAALAMYLARRVFIDPVAERLPAVATPPVAIPSVQLTMRSA